MLSYYGNGPMNNIVIRRDDVVIEGWLTRQSKYIRQWRSRWFVLTPDFLCCWTSQGEYSNPKEAIKVRDCRHVKSASRQLVGMDNAFRLDTPAREFVLVAESEEARDQWVQCLNETMETINFNKTRSSVRHSTLAVDVLSFLDVSGTIMTSASAETQAELQMALSMSGGDSPSSRNTRPALKTFLHHTPASEHRPSRHSLIIPQPLPPEFTVSGLVTEFCGVLQVRTGDLEIDDHIMPADIWLTFRDCTSRWLAVHSNSPEVPIGSTCDASSDTQAILAQNDGFDDPIELKMRRPAWSPVLSDVDITQAIQAAESAADEIIEEFLKNKTGPKQLVILYGPPGAGKQSFARECEEVRYETSVSMIQHQLVQRCSEELFRKLAHGRRRGLEDPFEKEAFLIESLLMSNRFTDVVNRLMWKGEKNIFSEALSRGLGIVMESTGAALATLRGYVNAAKEQGYRIRSFYCMRPNEVIRALGEERFRKELETGKMLGARRFDAFIDRFANMAMDGWPEVCSMSDDFREIQFDTQNPEVVLKCSITSFVNVLQLKTNDADEPDGVGKDVLMTYRAQSARWLVVHSGSPQAPLGSYAPYPNDVEGLVQRTQLRMQRPRWTPVLTDADYAEALEAGEQRFESTVAKALEGKTGPKNFVIMFGPPGGGKTAFAKGAKEVHYDTSVLLVQDEVLQECTSDIFRKLVAGRPDSRTDPFAKEAFLIESMQLNNRFMDLGNRVMWKGEQSIFNTALNKGVGILTETTGASLGLLQKLISAARDNGYKVIAFYLKISLQTIKERTEDRFNKELETGQMLGGRRFDAFLDRFAKMAEDSWPQLVPLCDIAHEVHFDNFTAAVTTTRRVTEKKGMLQFHSELGASDDESKGGDEVSVRSREESRSRISTGAVEDRNRLALPLRATQRKRTETVELKALSWNVGSLGYAVSPLEFVPGAGVLTAESQDTLDTLLCHCELLMTRPETSPKLSELLVGDRNPLLHAGELEATPIQLALLSEEQQAGLAGWLRERDIEVSPSEWCADLGVRWDFWKEQTLFEWLCDDGSGGIQSEHLPRPPTGTLHQHCWDLGLASADRDHGNSGRQARAWWVPGRVEGEPEAPEPTGQGKHDFFRLLVWDLILAEILSREPRENVASLLEELRPELLEKRMERIVEHVMRTDIAILCEVPGTLPAAFEQLSEEFWIIRAAEAHPKVNTMICMRKRVFSEPALETFFDQNGRVNPRVVGAFSARVTKAGQFVHVIGVHLSGRSYDTGHTQQQLEGKIQPLTILGGDFNSDVRTDKQWSNIASNAPKLHAMLQEANELPSGVGTCNKQWLPFQAQVTKMYRRDFSMKDFLLAGSGFSCSEVEGHVDTDRVLPDAEVPSEHAVLRFKCNIKMR